jgi:hypothetical protein
MKARYYVVIIGISLLLYGCSYAMYNKVFSSDDEFRNEKRSIVRVRLWAEEKYNEVDGAVLICEGIRKSDARTVRFYFNIPRSITGYRIKDEAYIKVGGNRYRVFAEDSESLFNHDNDLSISMFSSADSTGSKSGQTTDIKSRTWVEEKFVITAKDSVLYDMAKSKNMLFRFYFGPEMITYSLDGFKYDLVSKSAGVK